jgi:hypothetical protein
MSPHLCLMLTRGGFGVMEGMCAGSPQMHSQDLTTVHKTNIEFEVLTAVTMSSTIWNVTPCSLVEV